MSQPYFIVENKIMKEGDIILLKNALLSYMEYEKDNPEYSATITGKPGQRNAIKWDADFFVGTRNLIK